MTHTQRNITMTHRMRLTLIREGLVTLEYTDPDTGGRISRDFSCSRYPTRYGSYVYERAGRDDWRQTCRGLYSTGETLMISNAAALPDAIRREYRAMRRDWARAQREYYGAPR